MKTGYPRLIGLGVALALALGQFPLMARPVLACSWLEIEIYPPSGPVGTEITVVYWGADDHAGEWGNPAIPADGATFGGMNVAHPAQMEREGMFIITVPEVPPGDYEIVVTEWKVESRGRALFTVTEGPVRHNPSTMVGHTLARLDGKYERVWGYDPATQSWKVYDVRAQPINDLGLLEKWQTIWLKVTEDDVVLNWRGTLYFLKKGWNLIASLGDTYGIGQVLTAPPEDPGDH